ncbi:MAG: 4Fe-4S ferredoxin [Chloroflexi bacterium HGW-Chloroflexi-6]|nr:MAG: 4Fe-4S ferredoxin [Chloroflexi bacterium HGW-Chloroflexi-6]
MKVYVITKKCCQCGSCAAFCENKAIEWLDREYAIDQELCDGCGTCLEYCPIDDAIVEKVSEPA